LRVTIDKPLCGGTGLCAEICPSIFGQDADYIAFVMKDGVRAGDEDVAVAPEQVAVVREAAELCPTGAVVLSDESLESDGGSDAAE
jgi:ferredoxin